MGISLQDFISNLSNIVRPNRFKCIVSPPTGMLSNIIDSEVLQFYVHGATMPDRTFGEIPLKYFGMELKIPGNETNSDLTLTVLLDEEWETRDFFLKWCNLISSREDNSKGYMSDLFSDSYINVSSLDGDGNELRTVKYVNIFPKAVSEIELNMDTIDSAATFQVTLGYSHWI
jgi:hypothetical protein